MHLFLVATSCAFGPLAPLCRDIERIFMFDEHVERLQLLQLVLTNCKWAANQPGAE